MHSDEGMAAYSPYRLNDHAGAKWLGFAAAGFLFVVLTALAMFIYPHV